MTPNVAAFLRVIREGESSQDDDKAYHLLVYGGRFESESDHPRLHFDLRSHQLVPDWRNAPPFSTSSAAGAHQITETTYDALRAKFPGRWVGFSPAVQDDMAVALIEGRSALADVEAGRLSVALERLRDEWQSFQTMALPHAIAVFQQYGGTLAGEQPAAPIEDESTKARPEDVARVTQQEQPLLPLATIALPLLQSLLPQVLSLFSGRAQATIAEKTGADPAVAAQFMQGLIQQVGAAVGMVAATPGAPIVKDDAAAIQAVAALTAQVKDSAEKIKALEADSLDYLHDLTAAMKDVVDIYGAETKIETEAANAAAERAKGAEWDMAKTLVVGMFISCAILLVFVCGIAAYQVVATTNHQPTTEVWAAITGLIGTVFGIAVTVYAFRFGTSKGSGAKDIVISEMARRKGA